MKFTEVLDIYEDAPAAPAAPSGPAPVSNPVSMASGSKTSDMAQFTPKLGSKVTKRKKSKKIKIK